jgi:hypothetical protein
VRRAVVFLDSNENIASMAGKCFAIAEPPGERQTINIGRTTTFLAALVAQMLSEPKHNEPEDFARQCFGARRCAYDWTQHLVMSWKDTREKRIIDLFDDALGPLDEPAGDGIVPINSEQAVRKRWIDSSHDTGVVTYTSAAGKTRKLQLWRGESVLPRYICIGKRKRQEIDALVSKVKDFAEDTNPRSQLSCQITASPGWGKSYLARCLAAHLDMEPLWYSVAEMASAEAFVEVLAEIASVQSRIRKRLLVFMDEMDSPIQHQTVAPLLLGPLEGGDFRYHNLRFRLRPAAWVFASSAPITVVTDSKASDLATRLRGPWLDLDDLNFGSEAAIEARDLKKQVKAKMGKGVEEYDKFYKKKAAETRNSDYILPSLDLSGEDADARGPRIRTEQVYLMTQFLLEQHWGPIRQIHDVVIKFFRDIFPVNGVRSLRLLASRFGGPLEGRLLAEHVPDVRAHEELCRHVLVPEKWWSKRDDIIDANSDPTLSEFVEVEGMKGDE